MASGRISGHAHTRPSATLSRKREGALFVISFIVVCGALCALTVTALYADPNGVDVRSFGAKCDGSTDDSTAMQKAIDFADTSANSGNVIIPPLTCAFGRTLNLGTSSSQHHVNLIGSGPVRSVLLWKGSTSGIALKLNNLKYATIQGIALTNGVAKGTTEGVRATGTNFGTNSNGIVVERVTITGFHYGWRASDGDGKTSSEITFTDFSLQSCDTGFYNDSFNGLNFLFLNLQMGANATCGLDAAVGGIHVVGGSASGNATDFHFNNDSAQNISDFRSENVANLFVDFTAAGGANNLTILGCMVDGVKTPNAHTVISLRGGKVNIENCLIGGQILYKQSAGSGNEQSAVLRNNLIIDRNNTYTNTATPDLMGPGFELNANSGGGGTFESFGNTQCDGAFGKRVGEWPDGSGYITTSASGQGIAVMSGVGQGAALTVTSNAIRPTAYIHHVGSGRITTILVNPPAFSGCKVLIPDAAFTTDTTGNIAVSMSATIGKAVTFCYDPAASKWYPSEADPVATRTTRPASALLAGYSTATCGGVASLGNGADTTEDTICTYSLPASTLVRDGDSLRITTHGFFAANADTKTLKIHFGSFVLTLNPTSIAPTDAFWQTQSVVTRTGAASEIFSRGIAQIGATMQTIVANGTPTETLSGAITITVTGQDSTAPKANSIVLDSIEIEYVPAP